MILSPHACISCGRSPKKGERFSWKKYKYIWKRKRFENTEIFTAFVCPECFIVAKSRQKKNALSILFAELVFLVFSLIFVENNFYFYLKDPSTSNFLISLLIFILIAIPLSIYSEHPSKLFFHTSNHWGKLKFEFKSLIFQEKFKEKLIETSRLDLLQSY
jgi:hypothetical protein